MPYEEKTLVCRIVLSYKNLKMDLSNSKVKCETSPTKTIIIKQYMIRSEKKEFRFSLTIRKNGKGKISNPTIQNLDPPSTTSTTTATPGLNI